MATTPIESSGKYANGGGQKQHHHHEEEEDSINVALQWMNAIVLPLALRSSVELGVFDIIAKAGGGGEGAKLTAREIAAQIGTNNPDAPKMLDRILRLLASHSVLNCSIITEEDAEQGEEDQKQTLQYSLTPASKHFVTDDDGVSFGHTLTLILDKVFFQSWTEVKGAMMEGGIPFNRVYGMNAFEYPGVDGRFNDVFNKAMVSSSTITMKRILQLYNNGFENINRLVDVGGGLGVNLKMITSKYPNINAINLDLPHVIQHAPPYPRVEHVGGDMFDSVPKGDAIFMKQILHDWSDEDCLKVLKNCYEAVPDDGKIIVVDSIIPEVPLKTDTAKNAFSLDLFMLTQNPGGRERTHQQFTRLALNSGFGGVHFVCSAAGYWVMEFFK